MAKLTEEKSQEGLAALSHTRTQHRTHYYNRRAEHDSVLFQPSAEKMDDWLLFNLGVLKSGKNAQDPEPILDNGKLRNLIFLQKKGLFTCSIINQYQDIFLRDLRDILSTLCLSASENILDTRHKLYGPDICD